MLSGAKSMAMPRKSKVVSNLQPSSSTFKLLERERWFILDCVAVDTIAKDYSRAFPKLGSVIPLYDAQQDPHAAAYFASKPVLLLFQQIGQRDFLDKDLKFFLADKNPAITLSVAEFLAHVWKARVISYKAS